MSKKERFVDAYADGVITIKNVEHVPDRDKGIYIPVVRDVCRLDTNDPLIIDALKTLGWHHQEEILDIYAQIKSVYCKLL